MVLVSGQLIWSPIVVLILLTAWRRIPRNAFVVFLIFLAIGLMASDVTSSYVIKNLVQRLRPCRLEELRLALHLFGQKCGGRFGFVSSHASNSLLLVLLPILALRLERRFYLLGLLPLVVSYSRVYLGVHYPGDILGGYAVGLIWSVLLSLAFRSFLRRETT